MAVDLVCKIEMDEKTAKFTSEYKVKQYYFSAPGFKKALVNAREVPGWTEEGGLWM